MAMLTISEFFAVAVDGWISFVSDARAAELADTTADAVADEPCVMLADVHDALERAKSLDEIRAMLPVPRGKQRIVQFRFVREKYDGPIKVGEYLSGAVYEACASNLHRDSYGRWRLGVYEISIGGRPGIEPSFRYVIGSTGSLVKRPLRREVEK